MDANPSPSVRVPRILLVGDSGVGKTCFLNSLNTVLRQGASSSSPSSQTTRGFFGFSPRRGGGDGGGSSPAVAIGKESSGGGGKPPRSDAPPPPTTIGVLCDAICIKYGGAIKCVESVEIGGNRTFAPTARQTAYKSDAIAAVFLFYRPDSPDSIVNLSQWYDEVKKEVNERGSGLNTFGGGDEMAAGSSSPAFPSAGSRYSQPAQLNFYSEQGNNYHNSTGLFTSPQSHQRGTANGHGYGYGRDMQNSAMRPLLKLVLVSVVNPKSRSLIFRGREGSTSSNGRIDHLFEESGGQVTSGGYCFDEPTVLFRNTGLEPVGRFINKCATAVWHLSVLLLSMLLLGPGQRVVPLRPAKPADVLDRIESDPLFSLRLTVEFAANSNSRIDFKDSLDDVVQLLASLTA